MAASLDSRSRFVASAAAGELARRSASSFTSHGRELTLAGRDQSQLWRPPLRRRPPRAFRASRSSFSRPSIPLFLTCGIKFLGNLSLDISPPSDSLAALADADYDAAFPAQSRGEKDAYLLLLTLRSGAPILAEPRDRTSALEPSSQNFSRGVQAFVRDFAAAHGGDASWAECTDGLLSFECLHERNYSLLEATTLNTRNLSAATATLLRIQPPDDAVHTFGAALAAHVAGAPSELLVQTAGLPRFSRRRRTRCRPTSASWTWCRCRSPSSSSR